MEFHTEAHRMCLAAGKGRAAIRPGTVNSV
jgi:hypothetical protein